MFKILILLDKTDIKLYQRFSACMFIFGVDRMNSKRKVERNLGHVALTSFMEM